MLEVWGNEVRITSKAGYGPFVRMYYTRESLQKELGCCDAWAYRIMQRLPWVWVTDEPAGRRYRAVRRDLVQAYRLAHPRGNPQFRDASIQAAYALRRQRK